MDKYKITHNLDRSAWADFVSGHPQGNIFQTPVMVEALVGVKGVWPQLTAVLGPDNQILGVLVSMIQSNYWGFLKRMTSRSIIMGGPLIRDNDREVLEMILREYDQSVKHKAVYTQFRNLREQERSWKACFEQQGFTFEDHLNIRVRIDRSEETLWQEIHSKRRNEIRRALKEGTSVRELDTENDIRNAYAILTEVYRNARLPLPHISFFLSAFQILRAEGCIRFFAAVNREKIIGILVALCYKTEIHDWYAGSFKRAQPQYPNDLLPWEVFLWGKRNGYTVFDFGGAGKPGESYGVREYKKQFGGNLVNYGRYLKIHNPLLMRWGKGGFRLWRKFGFFGR
ncbi:MAG: lipid II:glycine glycyltransferase FemX [Candidatus Omnitrophota bacterium]